MPATLYTVNQTWQPSARYTAAAEVEINLYNPSPALSLRWSTTADDTPPAFAPQRANPLPSECHQAMILPAGARLWIATYEGAGTAGVEVMP